MAAYARQLSDDLLRLMLEDYRNQRGVCSVTGSVYCTAWVSMVAKSVNGKLVWLFPTSFQYVCDHQQTNGGWEGSDVVDEIINTLACLLSLKKHKKAQSEPSGLANKISNATKFLNERFLEWDVIKTERVAFEIIIPALLNLLERENIKFNFPCREVLLKLKEAKMSKFSLSQMYKYPSPMLYSLEAFIGIIDFNKIKHHVSKGEQYDGSAT